MNKRKTPEGFCTTCGHVTRTVGAIGQRCMRPYASGHKLEFKEIRSFARPKTFGLFGTGCGEFVFRRT
jgi:hypothetical protein